MTYLVTGSEGFIGRAFCRAHKSYGIDSKNHEYIQSYISYADVPEHSGIVHLAAESGILKCNLRPYISMNNNISGTLAALDIARRKNKKIVIASSAAAQLPINPYAASKLAGEAAAIAYHATYAVDYVCLRFANVYGPDSRDKGSVVAQMIKDALTDGVITVYGDGSQRRDFVYIDDIVEAIHLCLTDNNYRGLYSVGTDVMVSISELAEYIQELTGCKIQKKPSPRQEVTPATPDTKMIKCTIDWKAGVNKTVEWFKNEIKILPIPA
jgi:UDP-glucose 4-epimerase